MTVVSALNHSDSVNSSPLDLVSRIDSLVRAYVSDTGVAEPTARCIDIEVASRPAQSTLPGAPPVDPTTKLRVSAVSTPDDPAMAVMPPGQISEFVRSAKVMVVDDEHDQIESVKFHLKQAGYVTFVSTTLASEAMDMMRREHPDVVLLDVQMPELSGLDILRLKQTEPTLAAIPTIMLTAAAAPATKRAALECGANDFLTKPLDPDELMPRVRNALVMKKLQDQMAGETARLEQLVFRRTAELEHSRQQLILSLARATEHRDNETGYHVIRVGRYAGVIARALGWKETRIEMLEQAAQLHDVGKIGVPDAILFKPGKLEPSEFDVIKKHCDWGTGIIEPFSDQEFQLLKAHARLGESILHIRTSPMLMMASRIAQTHHENWDGSGYPLGLFEDEIPIEGRITAVADVFDALSSKRPYKDAFPREKCFEIMREQRGKKFEPQILDAFFAQTSSILRIQESLTDE
ncbi:MAG: HD domain-containing phosphohydrolase [Planctomycetota bacterium]